MTTPTDSGALSAQLGLPQGDPTPFPTDDAANVTSWAEEIDAWIAAGSAVTGVVVPNGQSFVAVVSDAIQIIKDILGDPRLVMDTALAWGTAAAVPTTIKQDLTDRKNVLISYWEGGAHDAFTGHLDAILAGMDTASAKMTEMAKTIAGAYTHVMNTYETGISYLGDCAANLAGLAALPFSLLDAAEFAKGFAEAIVTLQDSNLAIINDYRQDIINLSIDAITFPTLSSSSAVLDRIDDTDDWDVRAAS
ncbi:WXG100 family type VII secretion target [Kibdelosporangium persicum]|uniref:WXG100 family type VII secretion target n=1 Tax=Kibdelosporangium persicum TaxID=2698649 RepID=A0ABX2F659_9PSEU|nr:hypothetical protein [Kibdelosporangium persicum]NRN66421.1 hypothetical protein [Kibdelosporangium persicum]